MSHADMLHTRRQCHMLECHTLETMSHADMLHTRRQCYMLECHTLETVSHADMLQCHMLATDTLQLVFCVGVLVILVHTSSAVFVTVYEHLFQHMLQANFVLHQLKACGLSTSIRHVLAGTFLF